MQSLTLFYEKLTPDEMLMTDILRSIVIQHLPNYCREKFSYNVPFFYGNKSICLIWPASIPRGGIKEGVMLAFYYGNRLSDEDGYLDRGTNKQVFYKIFKHLDDIDEHKIVNILKSAIQLDASFAAKK